MPTDYLLYLRKSRADAEAEARGEGETLARHRKTLTDLAARRALPIAAVYEEIVSGDTIDQRPQMQRLLADIGTGAFAGVIVMEIERLARGDSIDQGIVAQAFKSVGAKIITPYRDYDPNNDMDEEFFEFGLFMARREYKTIKRRMQAGRVASVKEGNYLGTKIPYGYDRVIDRNGKQYTLTPNESEAAVVRSIFDWYAHGMGGVTVGCNAIANRLNDMGLTTKQGREWTRSAVLVILSNPLYIGMVRWNRRQTVVRIVDGKRVKKRPFGAEMIVPGKHPAIIDREVFDAVALVLSGHANPRQKCGLALSNPLAGLVVCAHCGKTLTQGSYSHDNTPALKCRTRGCPTVSASLAYVESAVMESLKRWIDQAESPAPVRPDAHSADAVAIEKLQAELTALDGQKKRAQEMLERDVYSVDEYLARKADIEARRKSIETTIQSLSENLSHADDFRLIVPRIKSVVSSYSAAPNADHKNRLLKSVVQKAVYEKAERGNRKTDTNGGISLVLYPRILPSDLVLK